MRARRWTDSSANIYITETGAPEMFLEEHESMRMAPVRVYDDEGAFFGIYEYQAEKEDYKPLKVFK